MSTITKEFTKEQLQQLEAAAKEALWPVVWSEKKAREHFSEKITPEVVLELARIAQERMDAKAVAWTDADELRDVRNGGNGYLFATGGEANKFADPHRQVLLYTSPPAQVVAELCAAIESLLDMQVRMVKQTNVGASFFDGETISAMNYAPIRAKQALELAKPYK